MQVVKKKYITQGVAPPSQCNQYYDDNRQAMVQDSGANWDADKRMWRRTVWVQSPSKYKIVYDDGTEDVRDNKLSVGTEIGTGQMIEEVVVESEEKESEEGKVIEPKFVEVKKKVIGVEEDAGAWQLQNEYISQAERPEWDEYLTRTPVYELTVGGQGVTPKRKFGGDWLARKAYQDSQVSGMLR